jgi:hypothetical protein
VIFRRNGGKKEVRDDETEVRRPPGRFVRLIVPSSLLQTSIHGLQGYVPREGLCYWYGRELEPGVGLAMVVAFPRIYSTESSFQLMDGQMSQLTTWSAQEDLWLLAQVHTHPTDEPHSNADEEWAPTYREGFLSLVIPFGAQFSNLRSPGWRLFECNAGGRWVNVGEEKLRILEDVWLPEK